ncbi:Glutathione s-transferase, partial [Globisporangium splendens]
MAAPYRHYIQPEADAEFPAEAGRYHLYVTYSCPFACRALAARNLKGLQDVIGLSVAHPIFQKTKPNDDSDDHLGWTFVDPAKERTIKGVNGQEYSTEGATTDPINNVRFVRDLYELVSKEPRRYTVPLLWDKKKQTIVSNESADILRTLNTGFRDLVPSNVDLLPEDLVTEVEAINDGVVQEIGAGFFRTIGKLTTDEYEKELEAVFAAIARVEAILSKSRYLVGSGITEADVRLFHTLIRLDVYQLPTSKHNLTQYPNLVNTPALKATVNWDHLKIGGVNHKPDAPLPVGPFVDYDAPHDRSRL